MWADVQRDGRPDEYRWRPLCKFRNSIPCTTPQSLAEARCWSNENARLGRKMNFARGKILSRGESPQNVYKSVPAQETTKNRAKLASSERRRCSNEAKTRNWLKFAGMPQTGKPISAVNRPKFAIL